MGSDEVQQIPLEEEYKKNTGITPADTEELRQWLRTQPHLPEQITDLELICAFHACDRSSGVSKRVLDLHFTLRTLFTHFFKDRTVDSVEDICNALLLTPIPMKTEEGDAIFYCHVLNPDPKAFVYADSAKAVLMIIDLWQYEEGTWPGFHLVVDFRGMSLGHLTRVDFRTLHQFIYFVQETLTVKLKGIYIINAPSWVDKVVMMLKAIMKKELMEHLHIYTAGSDTIKKHIPIEALPRDCGGAHRTSLECRDDVLRKLRANKAFFENENKKRVNESLRPGKPKSISNVFGGVEGSFKNLDID